jgi:uncharacterized membrane protein
MNTIRQNWELSLFVLAQVVIFLYVFQSGLYGKFLQEDFTLDYYYSTNIIHGLLPYRDFTVEYPPLAMLFTFLPRLVTSNLTGYYWAYTVEMLIFSLIGLFIIAALAKEMCLSLWKTLGIYTLGLLAIGPLITVRFDIIPALITLSAVYALIKGHSNLAWALLAGGVLTKLYPVVLAPVFLIYQLQHQPKRQTVIGIATFAITLAILTLPALIISPSGLWHSLTYHAQRGLQIESTYASILELGYSFGLIPLNFTFDYGSINAVSPLANKIAGLSFAIMMIGLLAFYWFYYRGLKNRHRMDSKSQGFEYDRALLLNYSLLAILVFILTSKVFSPQYIIWIFPFIPLVIGNWRTTCGLLFIMVGLMTFFIYPKYYAGIEHGELITVVTLVLRNVVLVVMAFLVLRRGSIISYLKAVSSG